MKLQELKEYLDQKADLYNSVDFIDEDPIQIPHRFRSKQDIEIAGFLSATISWGNRKSIINSGNKMMEIMGNSPYDFVLNHTEQDFKSLGAKAIHRTFNTEDFKFFIESLKRIYVKYNTLELLFKLEDKEQNFYHALERFRTAFLDETPQHRAKKHVSSTYKNASAKRLMMFLRWMVRKDNRGVDFGIWKNLDSRFLSIPLDVHTGNVARKLGLITRTQNDWKTVEELDVTLRKFNPEDPALYDYALFGVGVSKDLV